MKRRGAVFLLDFAAAVAVLCAGGAVAGTVSTSGNTFATGQTCAISSDGYLKCATDRPYQVLNTLNGSGSGDYVDVATTGDFTCAVTRSGGAQCWGQGEFGQLGNGSTSYSETPVDVTGLESGVAAITARYRYACALLDTGGVDCWGQNNFAWGTYLTPVVIGGLESGIVAVAAGAFHTCVLDDEGKVRCWGLNSYGQLGDGSTENEPAPPVGYVLDSVAAISAGDNHSCAVLRDGGIKCWGQGTSGRLGNGTTTSHSLPTDVASLPALATAIRAGAEHTCALLVDGRLACWGSNQYGQLGDANASDHLLPTIVPGIADVVDFDTGLIHTCARMASYALYCWGYEQPQYPAIAPTSVWGFPAPIATIDASGCGIDTAGDVYCDQRAPQNRIPAASGIDAVSRIGGGCVLNTQGRVFCGDGPLNERSGADFFPLIAVDGLPDDIVDVSGRFENSPNFGPFHRCALSASGAVYCWGHNNYGQVGDGTTIDRPEPVHVPGLSNVVAITSNSYATSCALLAGGGVKCWGFNSYGQVGDGTNATRYSPVDVVGLTAGVTAITMGYDTFGDDFACAVLQSGAVKCWGFNGSGELGDGSDVLNRLSPVDATGLTNAVAVTGGNQHACALTASGTIECWGAGYQSDTVPPVSVPTEVTQLGTGNRSVSAGTGTCAIDRERHALCWDVNAAVRYEVPTWYLRYDDVFRNGFDPE
jgi:alpha-tubulin suppressor-like RCC1 family protein